MLASCLAALARQTRPADEIVVIDNASTDNTAAVCAAAGARRIAVELPGIAASTACGFDAARCELIARLDTDSIPPADWLERVEAILEQSGPLSAVSGPGDFYGETRFARWVGTSVYIPGVFLGHRKSCWVTLRCLARTSPCGPRSGTGSAAPFIGGFRPSMMIWTFPTRSRRK